MTTWDSVSLTKSLGCSACPLQELPAVCFRTAAADIYIFPHWIHVSVLWDCIECLHPCSMCIPCSLTLMVLEILSDLVLCPVSCQ